MKMGWNLDNSYARLPKSFFTSQKPISVASPKLAVLNVPLAVSLGLNPEELQSEEGIKIFAGNQIPEGASPLAQAYAGHQFGYFTMLGDGRAILLGEQITPDGERFDIQLKGSGPTIYSRRGDGRGALGPMLREYIISEAMHGLGIPTTRSLAVVTTGESVIRETDLPGAVLTRVASSHLRFGTFQYVRQFGSYDELKILADYALNRHFPGVLLNDGRYLSLLQEVIKRQALLVAKWQLAGFIHGVMNTDNMTVSGETMDYGPCAFMDHYDPATVFSSIDVQGRYAYSNQPHAAAWNLARFAETLLPLLHDNPQQAAQTAQEAVSAFDDLYHLHWLEGMRLKLGINSQETEDELLIEGLLDIMQKYRYDYTNTFRALTADTVQGSFLAGNSEFARWYELWQARLCRQEQTQESLHQLMRSNNPAVIPRNHLVETALEAAVTKGDYGLMNKLLSVLSNPYAYNAEQCEYAGPPDQPSAPYQTFCGT